MNADRKAEQLSFLEAPPVPGSPRQGREREDDALAGMRPEDLPPSLRKLCDLIGLPKVIRLVRAYGGMRLHIPHCAPDENALCRLIGRPAARLLGQHYGGDDVYVPSLARVRRETRNHRIRRSYDAGSTVRDLAMREGLSERWITEIVNSPDEA